MTNDNINDTADGQLIADEEERLPWLESADDYSSGSGSSMKILGVFAAKS